MSTAHTPAEHQAVSDLKATRIQSFNPDKTVTAEFPGGFTKNILVATPSDAWAPVFDRLAYPDVSQLEEFASTETLNPNGTKTVIFSPLAFIQKTVNKRGTNWTIDGFAIAPTGDACNDRDAGTRAFMDLAAHAKTTVDSSKSNASLVQLALISAVEKMQDNDTKPYNHGARQFVEMLADVAMSGFVTLDCAAYAQTKLANNESVRQSCAQYEAEQAQKRKDREARKAAKQARAAIKAAQAVGEVAQ